MRRIGKLGWKSGSGEESYFDIRTIYDVFDVVKKKPGLYIQGPSISLLEAFYHGYDNALHAHGVALDTEEPPFHHFHDYVASCYGRDPSAKGWCTILLEECGGDEEEAFDHFFRLLRAFRGKPTTA